MKKSPVALGVAGLLFVGWLTFLGYQAVRDRHPVVVSRAQLAVSQYDIEADLEANPGKDNTLPLSVRVKAVRWEIDNKGPTVGDEITILNLDKVQGYQGKKPKGNVYVIPLVKKGKDYEVAGLPMDPGYPQVKEPPKPRIYYLPDVEKQVEQIVADKNALHGRSG